MIDAQPGENKTFSAPLGHIPVFIRGGYVLPQQEALYTTAECRNSSWSLIAALSNDETATGSLYVDDGESLVQEATLLAEFTVSNGSLWASARGLYQDRNVSSLPLKLCSISLTLFRLSRTSLYSVSRASRPRLPSTARAS